MSWSFQSLNYILSRYNFIWQHLTIISYYLSVILQCLTLNSDDSWSRYYHVIGTWLNFVHFLLEFYICIHIRCVVHWSICRALRSPKYTRVQNSNWQSPFFIFQHLNSTLQQHRFYFSTFRCPIPSLFKLIYTNNGQPVLSFSI